MPELGSRGATCKFNFLRSVNPIPNRGGPIMPTNYYEHPQIFSPSGITAKNIEKIKVLTRGSSPKMNSAKFGIDLGTWQTINTKTITIEIRVNLISLLLSAAPITVFPLKQLHFTRLEDV